MMKHIEQANKAIDNAGGNQALARKLADKTNGDYEKMYGRVRMWRVNGISLPFIRYVAKFGKVKITTLVPDYKND